MLSIFNSKPPKDDQRTVESARYEPRLEADRMTVERLFEAIDQATAGDTTLLFTIYRDYLLGDPHIQSEFGKRKLAVLGDTISISPADRNKPDDVAAADFIKAQIPRGIPGWRHACSHLLDSTLWPVSVLEKVFRLENGRYVIDRLVPVPYHLLDFREGTLRLKDQAADGQTLTSTQAVDPNRYIVHRGHLLTSPDNFGGPFRSILFWTLFCNNDRSWWIRFLDRFGSPFLVGKYTPGDTAAKDLLVRAFSAATHLFGLAVSKSVDIELKEATSGNGDAFEKFFMVARREQSKLIIGQTLSAEAANPGLGDGGSDLHSQVRDDIRQFDAVMLLEAAINDQLVKQLLFINGFSGQPPSINWGSASTAQLKAKVSVIKELYLAGAELADESYKTLSDELGFAIKRRTFAGDIMPPISPLSAEPYYRRRQLP
jgi:phage gp29-like protein